MKKAILPLVLLVLLSNCKSTKESVAAVAYNPTEQQIQAAQARWPSANVSELLEGNKIYTTQCNKCHGNFPVEQFSEKKWLHEIDAMAPKANLSAEEKTRLTRYILSMRDTKVSPVKN